MGDPVTQFLAAPLSLAKEARDERKEYERKTDEANRRAEQARTAAAMRERRQMARQAIMARAQAQMAGVASGGGLGSSAVRGASSSITSQAAGNLNFLDNQTLAANQISSLQQQAQRHANRSARYQGYFNTYMDLSMKAASMGASAGGGGASNSGGTTG